MHKLKQAGEKKVCSRKSKSTVRVVHNIVGVMLKVLVTVGCTVPCPTSTNYKTTTYDTLHNIVMIGNVPYRYLTLLSDIRVRVPQAHCLMLLLRKFKENKLRCMVL